MKTDHNNTEAALAAAQDRVNFWNECRLASRTASRTYFRARMDHWLAVVAELEGRAA